MVVAPAPNFESSLLDLHELTVQEAHDATLRFLNATSYKAVTIITGKSGVICKEFPHWMNLWGYRYIALKGGGAYRVNTKRI
jgi:hypothetical protein